MKARRKQTIIYMKKKELKHRHTPKLRYIQSNIIGKGSIVGE
jgi:hypothetical protein